MNNSGRQQGSSGDGSRRPFPRHGGGRHQPGQRGAPARQGSNPPGREPAPPVFKKEDFKRPPVDADCAICGKPLFDLAGALGDKESGKPVHFDCALEKVQAAEKLAEGERLVYLGAGCFGVVVYKNGQDGAFTVVRRIRWEREGEKQPWRKDISSFITKI